MATHGIVIRSKVLKEMKNKIMSSGEINNLTPNFNWKEYKKLNPDLMLNDKKSLESHWYTTGRWEGRLSKFHPRLYWDRNKQIHKLFNYEYNSTRIRKYWNNLPDNTSITVPIAVATGVPAVAAVAATAATPGDTATIATAATAATPATTANTAAVVTAATATTAATAAPTATVASVGNPTDVDNTDSDTGDEFIVSSNSKKKKIAFIVNNTDIGGAEYVTWQHLVHTNRMGYETVFIGRCEGPLSQLCSKEKTQIYYMNNDTFDTICERVLKTCDILYICNHFTFLPYVYEWSKRTAGTRKIIVTAHNGGDFIISWIIKHVHMIDKIMCIHDKVKERFLQNGIADRKLYVVNNWIDFNNVKEVPENRKQDIRTFYKIPKDRKVIGMITRIEKDKNIDSAIDIFARLPSNTYHLLIVGGGPLMNTIYEKIVKLKLDTSVTITGFIDYAAVDEVISIFDICLNTSTIEGLPISLLQALAKDIHCVFPDSGNIKHVIGDYGTTVPFKERVGGTYTKDEIDLFVFAIKNLKKYEPGVIQKYAQETWDVSKLKHELQILFEGYKKGLSFIIRARNEEDNIEQCLTSIVDIADEIIFVNHLSTDKTYEKALTMAQRYSNIKPYNFMNEIPKCGINYSKNKDNFSYTIADYYNFCLSKSTYSTIVKWDADFIANRANLKELVKLIKKTIDTDNKIIGNKIAATKVASNIAVDKIAGWFTGLTVYVDDENRAYVNTTSFYDEYRIFSKKKGFRWKDANKCEYADPQYINSCNKIKFEKPCFYEIKKTTKDEFISRESMIDKRDLNDFDMLSRLKNLHVDTPIPITNLKQIDINSINSC